jgi:hypothetical protein
MPQDLQEKNCKEEIQEEGDSVPKHLQGLSQDEINMIKLMAKILVKSFTEGTFANYCNNM